MLKFTGVCLCLVVTAPSSPPLNFVATSTDPRSIVLRWDPPPPEDRNGPITNYIINVTVVETRETFDINTTSTTFRLERLTPYTTYRFTIAASTEVGLGPFSALFTERTPEDGVLESVNLHSSNAFDILNVWSKYMTFCICEKEG